MEFSPPAGSTLSEVGVWKTVAAPGNVQYRQRRAGSPVHDGYRAALCHASNARTSSLRADLLTVDGNHDLNYRQDAAVQGR